MQTDTIDFAAKTKLVDALLACPSIQDRQTRNAIVGELKNEKRISRSEIPLTDVFNIVKRASSFQDDLSTLRDVLHFYEGDSAHMQQLDALYRQFGIPFGETITPNQPRANSFDARLIWSIVGLILLAILITILRPDFLFQPTAIIDSSSFASESTATYLPSTSTPSPPTATFTPTPTPTLGIGSTYVNPVDGATYVYVPAGDFIMGSEGGESDERPVHTVYLNSYWVMQTEVTNAQYRKFMDVGGYTNEAYWSTESWVWRTENNVTQPSCWNNEDFNDAQQPVICVNWYEAQAYVNWLSVETELDFGLPTEAQWEKAARGPNGYLYSWGNEWDGMRLNFCDKSCPKDPVDENLDDGYPYTAPVGSYPSGISHYKLLDVAGNVWEWTADWYGKSYYSDSPEQNPRGPATGEHRVIRGGSWNYTRRDFKVANRITNRGLYHGGLREGIGFRVRLSSLGTSQ